jgi:hypothetical protein
MLTRHRPSLKPFGVRASGSSSLADVGLPFVIFGDGVRVGERVVGQSWNGEGGSPNAVMRLTATFNAARFA